MSDLCLVLMINIRGVEDVASIPQFCPIIKIKTSKCLVYFLVTRICFLACRSVGNHILAGQQSGWLDRVKTRQRTFIDVLV